MIYKFDFVDQEEDLSLDNCRPVKQLPTQKWDTIVHKNNGIIGDPDLVGNVSIYCDWSKDVVYIETETILESGSRLTIFAMQLY